MAKNHGLKSPAERRKGKTGNAGGGACENVAVVENGRFLATLVISHQRCPMTALLKDAIVAAIDGLIDALAERVVEHLSSRMCPSAPPAAQDADRVLPERRFLTQHEVSEWAGLSVSTCVRARKSGQLNGRKVGGRWMYEVAEVEAWLRGGLSVRAP